MTSQNNKVGRYFATKRPLRSIVKLLPIAFKAGHLSGPSLGRGTNIFFASAPLGFFFFVSGNSWNDRPTMRPQYAARGPICRQLTGTRAANPIAEYDQRWSMTRSPQKETSAGGEQMTLFTSGAIQRIFFHYFRRLRRGVGFAVWLPVDHPL